ncbi:MAG: transposase [Clostridia bacterium]|nr:transposase [Clostridia bacterium]
MKKNTITKVYCTPKQLKIPIEIEKIIDFSDPVYSFSEIIDCIDLTSYFADKKGCKIGRPRYSYIVLLKIVLFSFMENGYLSLRKIEKSCKTDIRYMWLLDDMKAPSFVTIGNFIRDNLTNSIENIFLAINKVIFEKEQVDLEHTYIDGTKIEANANKYSWVWKKSCINNRNKVFEKISEIIEKINIQDLVSFNIKIEKRSEYAIEYVEEILREYKKLLLIDENKFVYGKGKRKTDYQRKYETLKEYKEKLMSYAKHIEICGEHRGSYSKTDNSATFMRIKRDYMGNDQLLPAYNMQVAVCDEYIATIDIKQYASDTDCFIPLMEKYNMYYGKYPKYPIADAAYGSFNNYIYCEKHGMEKFMKFTMFEKETKDQKYKDNPYRAVNFKQDELGNLVCPNGRKFKFKYEQHVKGNHYGRTEEIYECENCEGCSHKEKCCPKAKYNRTIRLNHELTSIHEEVLRNLCSAQGALLCMNRSIQAEGTYGILKWDKSYKRVRRKGLDNVNLEFILIACGFNLNKYHNKKYRIDKCA